MLHILKNRRDQARSTDDGFTLIELMVVVLIIAILLAIAIPTFLGAQNKAKDRSAQSSLRNGLTAAKTIYTDSSDYTDGDAARRLGRRRAVADVRRDRRRRPTRRSCPSTADGERRSTPRRCRRPSTCFYIKDVVASWRRDHLPQGHEPDAGDVHRHRRATLDARRLTATRSQLVI